MRNLVIFFILLSMYTSCKYSNDNQAKSASTLEKITSSKVMNVGYLEFPPCVIKDKSTGKLSGIFVDMVNQISKSLDTTIKVNWVETSLANFTADLKTGKFDFSVGPTFVNIPRSSVVSFTNPVCFVGNCGAIKKGTSSKYNSLDKLNNSNVRIAVLQGQAMEAYCKTFLPKATLVIIAGKDLTAPLQAVSSNRADIGFMNVSTTSNFVKEHSELEVISYNNDNLEVLPLSWSARLNDIEVQNFLNSSITYLESTGRISEYQKKYEIKLLYNTKNLTVAK